MKKKTTKLQRSQSRLLKKGKKMPGVADVMAAYSGFMIFDDTYKQYLMAINTSEPVVCNDISSQR